MYLEELLPDDVDDDDLDDELPDLNDLEAREIFLNIHLIGKAMWAENPDFREKTRNIAAKLIVQFVEGTFGTTHKLPTYFSEPVSDDFFELDIEATLEHSIENPRLNVLPWTYKRRESRNPFVLMLDTSFSMNGSKLLIAGLTIATLGRLVPSKDLAVIGFSKETYFIKRFDEELSPYSLVSRLFNIIPKGLTNLHDALQEGNRLTYMNRHHSRLIMLTDADPSTGKNPLIEASKLYSLEILLFPQGNRWLGKRLVLEANKGSLYPLNQVSDVVVVLKKLLSYQS